ncbi:MAG: thiamine ABC transporter substrate-binding protein [Sphaerochaetaceae bacterium]|nr:thiamine ABC transporter substrate-binding protein [Sphaerochaetaceae bacterium]
MKKSITVILVLILALSLSFARGQVEEKNEEKVLTLYCYDTFSSEWGSGPTLIPLFEEKTGIKVNVVSTGDAIQMLNQAITEADRCPADVVMGISDDSASAAYKSGLFASYDSPELKNVSDDLVFDSEKRLLPFDYGAFAFVYDTQSNIPEPKSLEDLKDPIYKNKVILIDPRTSSVGLGLLLWTIEVYGEDGYLDWWKAVGENALTIADGWSTAYGLFTEGEAPIVLSYTTSPVYHAMWEKSTRYKALIFSEGHAKTIESIGILKNSKHKKEAEAFVDFILSDGQVETAVANSMYPANNTVTLPEEYKYAPVPEKLLSIDEETIAEKLDKWTEDWTKAMVK